MAVLRLGVLLACLAAALAGPAGAAAPPRPRLDIHGDPLPDGAMARLGKWREGQKGSAGAVGFSPDGKAVISVRGGLVRTWEALTGKLLSRQDHKDERFLTFSPDGHLVFAEETGLIRLRDRARGQTIRAWDGHTKTALAAVFSADGKRMATSGEDGLLCVWAATSRQSIWSRNYKSARPLGFSRDRKHLIFAEEYSPFWCDVETGKETGILKGYVPLAVSPEGAFLVVRESISHDRWPLTFWNVAEIKRLRQVLRQEDIRTTRIAFTADDRTLAVGEWDGEIALFDLVSGKEIVRWRGHRGGVLSFAFSPDNRLLVSSGEDGTGLVWDLPGRVGAGKSLRTRLTPRELDALWQDLASDDSRRARRAVWRLAAVPRQVVPLLAERLPPPATTLNQVGSLLPGLGSEDFETRRKATLELEKLGNDAGPALERLLSNTNDLEVRRRVDRLLDRLRGRGNEPARRRGSRAVHVLEQIGTPEARVLLRRLEGNAAGARLGAEAKAALQRLARRPAPER